MENNTSNLKDILSNKKLKISIPIIQRDYAQGRKDAATIRDKFLDEIFNRLDNDENLFLDFNRSINLEKKNVIIDYIKNNKDILDETLSISQRYLDKAENSIAEINEEVNKELIFIMNRLARREY